MKLRVIIFILISGGFVDRPVVSCVGKNVLVNAGDDKGMSQDSHKQIIITKQMAAKKYRQ